jgi:hypothetical protein
VSTSLCQIKVEFYIEIHPFIVPSECQHFQCNATREINIMYHTWAFQGNKHDGDDVRFHNTNADSPFDANVDVQVSVDMGLFAGHGVTQTHQNVCDGVHMAVVFIKMNRVYLDRK